MELGNKDLTLSVGEFTLIRVPNATSTNDMRVIGIKSSAVADFPSQNIRNLRNSVPTLGLDNHF